MIRLLINDSDFMFRSTSRCSDFILLNVNNSIDKDCGRLYILSKTIYNVLCYLNIWR